MSSILLQINDLGVGGADLDLVAYRAAEKGLRSRLYIGKRPLHWVGFIHADDFEGAAARAANIWRLYIRRRATTPKTLTSTTSYVIHVLSAEALGTFR